MNKLHISLRGLIGASSVLCCVVAVMASRGFINPTVMAVLWGALLLSFPLDNCGWRRPPRLVFNVASIGAFVLAFANVRLTSIVEPFMDALILLLAVKMLEEKRARDYAQIVIISALIVVCSAVLSLRSSFVMYYVIMSYLAGAVFLLCSLFSRCPDLRWGVREAAGVFWRALVIWTMMLPVCLVLFFVAPRARTALASPQYQSGSTNAGFSDRVTHGMISSIQESDEIAFRAEMSPVPPTELYWRGLVLSTFDGRTWVAATAQGNRDRGYMTGGERFTQRILLETGLYRVLFTLDKPIIVNGDMVFPMGDGVFMRGMSRLSRQFSYSAVSGLSPVMKPNEPLSERNRNRNLLLPEGFIPAMRSIVDEITSDKEETEKINAIMGFLSPPNFAYTLDNLPVSQDPLAEFLFTTKRGNCEYFASAMAVMCRMAGIPARLVAGYRGGYYNASGEYYIVRQRNAHAWVEAWDSVENVWRRYDPTPAYTETGDGLVNDEPGTLSMFLDLLSYRVMMLFVEYSGEIQLSALEKLQAFLLNPGASFDSIVSRAARAARAAALPAGAAVVTAVACFLAVFLWRKTRRSPEAAVLADFLQAMDDRGISKHLSQGLLEFAESIPERSAVLREPAIRFATLFDEDYFRDRAMSAEKLSKLRGIVAWIRDAE